MNILILATHLNSGGITSYIWRLVRVLSRMGHHICVVTSGGNMVDEVISLGAEHVTMDIRTKSELSPKIYFALPTLCRLIKEKKIDVIHAQTRVTQVMGFFLSKLTGKPYVSTCHGFFKTRLSRKIFPCWGNRVIAISEPVKNHLISDFGLKENQVRLIYHGIDITRFPLFDEETKKRERHKLGIKEDSPVIGIIARFSDVKGHKFLLYAMKKVVQKFPNAILFIAGTGRMENELKQLSENLVLQNNVIFYPSVNQANIPRLLGVFDISAVPSLSEGLGLSVMESQASALPVIASATGGILDIVKDGQTGFLVSPGNADSLGEMIIRLLENRAMAREVGLAARKFIENEFPVTRMINQTLELYQEAIDENNP